MVAQSTTEKHLRQARRLAKDQFPTAEKTWDSAGLHAVGSTSAAWAGGSGRREARAMALSNWLPAAVRAAAVERRLQAGQTLFRRGNRAAGLYEIVRGKVRLA